MVFEFKLPDIGEGVHEGEISSWLVKAGDPIREDQPMVEVMTDKVTVEITAPVSGTVQTLHYGAGDVVKVGSIIVSIDEAATGSATAPVAATPAEPPESKPETVAQSLPQSNGSGQQAPAPVMAPAATATATGTRVLAPPAVRKLARSLGVDLAAVTGSGPQGRIRKADLQGLGGGGASVTQLPQARPSLVQPTREETRIPFIGMRRRIGEHLVKSKQTAPHFTYVEEADMSAIVAMKADLEHDAAAAGVKLTYLPFIVKAVIEGLKRFPKLNSTLDEAAQQIVLKPEFNIGIAVATGDGLIVPVVKAADTKSLLQIAAEITELGLKARNNKLAMPDLQGGTFTLTSIGSIGGIMSAPIINHPEVAIMGIHKIEKRPVVRNDAIVIREMTYFSLSGDHRVVDGAEVALFMKEVIHWLEHPGKFLLNL